MCWHTQLQISPLCKVGSWDEAALAVPVATCGGRQWLTSQVQTPSRWGKGDLPGTEDGVSCCTPAGPVGESALQQSNRHHDAASPHTSRIASIVPQPAFMFCLGEPIRAYQLR